MADCKSPSVSFHKRAVFRGKSLSARRASCIRVTGAGPQNQNYTFVGKSEGRHEAYKTEGEEVKRRLLAGNR